MNVADADESLWPMRKKLMTKMERKRKRKRKKTQ
jgi:hypothetical protein